MQYMADFGTSLKNYYPGNAVNKLHIEKGEIIHSISPRHGMGMPEFAADLTWNKIGTSPASRWLCAAPAAGAEWRRWWRRGASRRRWRTVAMLFANRWRPNAGRNTCRGSRTSPTWPGTPNTVNQTAINYELVTIAVLKYFFRVQVKDNEDML